MNNIKKKLLLILVFIMMSLAIICWAYREKISAYCFESADRRYRETGRHPGGFDGESCDKYAGGLLFKYRAALFFNKRNYDAVWELLDTLEACRGKQAVLDEAEKMYKDEPNDANYLLAIHLYQAVNGEEKLSLETLERINAIDGNFLADKGFCGELTFLYLKLGQNENGIKSLDRCCKLAKAGHGDIKQRCGEDVDAYLKILMMPISVLSQFAGRERGGNTAATPTIKMPDRASRKRQ